MKYIPLILAIILIVIVGIIGIVDPENISLNIVLSLFCIINYLEYVRRDIIDNS